MDQMRFETICMSIKWTLWQNSRPKYHPPVLTQAHSTRQSRTHRWRRQSWWSCLFSSCLYWGQPIWCHRLSLCPGSHRVQTQQCEFQESLWKVELLFPQCASWPNKSNEIILREFLGLKQIIFKLFMIKSIAHVTLASFGFLTDQPTEAETQRGSVKQAAKPDWQFSSI